MRTILLILIFLTNNIFADTIDHYMNIADNIPKMEMKADPQAQLWARSARNILTLTCDSIAETLILTNESANKVGKPFFCLPPGTKLEAEKLNDLIQQTYRKLASQQGDVNKMTVSEIALLAVKQEYPCSEPSNASTAMMHVANFNEIQE
ncbi:hypothetical protein [Legionella londiniensis]|uniref:Phosphatase n=1 Tax=Legionella londiniensis TaxID=45068 RepID=A0A0W0VLP9_9GAMM|nr:hypothetical protein [Legionella londiniensis]KTD21034.1 phosphatase [Legionella londiniensis]STX93691.1 phosphatase [Legionella londiniensis]